MSEFSLQYFWKKTEPPQVRYARRFGELSAYFACEVPFVQVLLAKKDWDKKLLLTD